MKEQFLRFLRSPLGIGVVGFNAAAAVALALFSLLPLPLIVLLCVIMTVLELLFLLQGRLGATAVVAERDREREERDARILGGVAAARKRLSLLRIDDTEVSEALARLIYAAGLYLEATVAGSDRDPDIEDAVFSAVEAVDDYLRLRDAAASSARLRGGRGEEEHVAADVASRTAHALASAAERIGGRLDLAAGGSRSGASPADRMAAREELE